MQRYLQDLRQERRQLMSLIEAYSDANNDDDRRLHSLERRLKTINIAIGRFFVTSNARPLPAKS